MWPVYSHMCVSPTLWQFHGSIPWVAPGRVQQIHGTFASDSVQWCSVGDPSMIQGCSVHRMYPGNQRLMAMAMWDNVGTTPMMGLVQIGDWWTILYLLEPDGHEWDVRYARGRYSTCLFPTNLEIVWPFWYCDGNYPCHCSKPATACLILWGRLPCLLACSAALKCWVSVVFQHDWLLDSPWNWVGLG